MMAATTYSYICDRWLVAKLTNDKISKWQNNNLPLNSLIAEAKLSY